MDIFLTEFTVLAVLKAAEAGTTDRRCPVASAGADKATDGAARAGDSAGGAPITARGSGRSQRHGDPAGNETCRVGANGDGALRGR